MEENFWPTSELSSYKKNSVASNFTIYTVHSLLNCGDELKTNYTNRKCTVNEEINIRKFFLRGREKQR